MIRLALIVFLTVLFGHKGLTQNYQLKHYGKTKGLHTAFIYDITNDTKGALWVAGGNGLYRFNGLAWVRELGNEEVGNTVIRQVVEHEGDIFLGMDDGRILQYNIDRDEITDSAATESVSRIIHMNFEDGLMTTFQQNGHITLFKSSSNQELIHKTDHPINRVFKFNDQMIAGDDENLSIVSKGSISSYNIYNTEEMRPDFINLFFELENRESLVGPDKVYTSGKKGISVFDKKLETMLFQISEDNGLNTDHVNSIFLDTENTLWVGTDGAGLYSLPELHYSSYPSDLALHDIKKHGEFLFAVGQDSVIKYQLKYNKDHIQLQLKGGYGIPEASRLSEVGGQLWLSTMGLGLFEYSDTAGRFVQIQLPDAIHDELLFVNSIATIDGNYYFSTPHSGVIVTNKSFEKVEHYNTTNGLSHNDINSVFKLKNKLWFLSKYNGVSSVQDGEWEHFDGNSGLKNSSINDALELDIGVLFTSEGSGCVLINDRLNFLKSELKGLPKYVYGAVQTMDYVVVCSGDEILLLNKQLNRIEDDLNVKSNMVGAQIASLNKNTFVATSEDGLILVNAAKYPEPPMVKINISSFEAKGVSYDPSEKIILNYGEYNIRIAVEPISLNHAENLLYTYKLEGYDEKWSKPAYLSEIRYKKLKEGNYTLRIKPVLPYSSEDLEEIQIEFEIKTPFWKTTTFIVIMIVLIILVIVIITEIRNRSIKRYSNLLKRKVERRTKQLQTQNKRLEEYTYAISHDLKNPVINIKGLTEILKEDISGEEKQQVISLMENTSEQLHKNLLGFIEALKVGGHGKLDNYEDIDLNQLIGEVETVIALDIISSKAEIIKKIEVDRIEFRREDLRSILYNFMSNAIKYRSPKRKLHLQIRTEKTSEGVNIIIADNGLGMDLSTSKERLFGMFKRVHDHVEGSGIGLYLVNSMVERAGGSIDVESTPDVGTSFTIFIPQSDKKSSERITIFRGRS